MSRRAVTVVRLLIVGVVVASGSLGVGVVAVEPAQSDTAIYGPSPGGHGPGTIDAQSPLALGDDRFDRTLFEITVYENRSAQWRFQFTQRLDNNTEEADFETYAAEFRANETELYRQFVVGAEDLTRTGSNVTRREMNATDFARNAYTDAFDNLGVVEMSFVWTNFAQQGDGGVVIGDVFEGGLAIDGDQRLRIAAGPSLAVAGDSVDPLPSNTTEQMLTGTDAVEWVGEYVFADRRPTVTFVPVAAETTPGPGVVTTEDTETASGERTTSERVDTTATPSNATANGSMPFVGLGWMVLGLVVIALVVVVATWRLGYFDIGEDESGDDDGGGDDSGVDGSGSHAGSAGETGESALTEAALASDDDRVRGLLEDNAGRMRQTEIVEATEWSKSKVSMLLSEMEDDGEITKLRVGRENIVSLPGSEPAAARSPFDDLDDEE